MQGAKRDRTLHLLTHCWETSESNVRQLIEERYHAHDEVFITRLLFGELRAELKPRNDSGEFEVAFKQDLQDHFTEHSIRSEVTRMSKGIVARVSYHEPHIEKRTGGDMGLAVARPIVRRASTTRLVYKVAQQGVLSQAKREDAKRKFGAFTEKQREVLPQHMDYAAILLYAYEQREQYRLAPFLWLPCNGCTLAEIEEVLKDYDSCMAEGIQSEAVLRVLWRGNIGTGDDRIIAEHICPGDAPYILIEITWRDGTPEAPPPPPPSGLTTHHSSWAKPGSSASYHPPVQHQEPPMQAQLGR